VKTPGKAIEPTSSRMRWMRVLPMVAPERDERTVAGGGTAYLPRHAAPVATKRALSSPSHVLAHLGGATDHANRSGSPEPFHKPTLGALLAFNLTHTHDRKHENCTRGHLHTFTFFLSRRRDFLG
jgi:hypothetical protein